MIQSFQKSEKLINLENLQISKLAKQNKKNPNKSDNYCDPQVIIAQHPSTYPLYYRILRCARWLTHFEGPMTR